MTSQRQWSDGKSSHLPCDWNGISLACLLYKIWLLHKCSTVVMIKGKICYPEVARARSFEMSVFESMCSVCETDPGLLSRTPVLSVHTVQKTGLPYHLRLMLTLHRAGEFISWKWAWSEWAHSEGSGWVKSGERALGHGEFFPGGLLCRLFYDSRYLALSEAPCVRTIPSRRIRIRCIYGTRNYDTGDICTLLLMRVFIKILF